MHLIYLAYTLRRETVMRLLHKSVLQPQPVTTKQSAFTEMTTVAVET